MTAVSNVAGRAGMTRGAVTWLMYLLLGYFTYVNAIQGNIIPFLRVELNVGYGAVGLHASAIAAGVICVGLFGDRIVRRFGRGNVLRVGALSCGVGLVILTLAANVYVSVGSCFLMGLAGAFMPAIVPAVLSDVHGSRRDVAITEANAICYVFAIAAPLIAGATVAAGWNWRTVPLAAVAAVVLIVVAFWRTDVPDAVPGELAEVRPASPLPPAYWAYWAMLGFSVAVEFVGLLWAPAYLEQVIGLSRSNAALVAGAFFVAMLVGRTIGIRLVGIYDPRNILFAMTASTFIGFFCYWLGGPVVAVTGLFLIGLGVSLLFPITQSYALAVGGADSNRASSRLMLAPGLAILTNPPLLGALADNVGLWLAQLLLPVFAALVILAFLIAQNLERRGYSASSS